MTLRFFAFSFLVACGSPPPATPVVEKAADPPVVAAKKQEAPVIAVARALAQAFAQCNRPQAKQRIMTYEEAAVMVTLDLPRDRWETSIEKTVDTACRALDGATVSDVEIVSSEEVKPSEKDRLARPITVVTLRARVADHDFSFPHPFVETRDGWKMMAED